MPSECIKCSLDDGTSFSNTTLEGSEVPQKADIVFVVSHRSCNTDLKSKLNKLVTQIDMNLKSIGIKKPRFSMVGYGGHGKLWESHSHTMEAELFNSKFKFPQALQNFEIDSEDIY